MKKLFAVSLLLTVLSAAVFAQVKDGITIGAWGQVVVAPVVATLDNDDAGKDADVYTGIGAGFQTSPRLRLDVNGAGPDGKYGFTFRIATNNLSSLGVQNYARVWVSPIPQIRIDVGQFREDALMGKIIDNDSFQYVLPMEAGNSIFTRFDTGSTTVATATTTTTIPVSVEDEDTPPNVSTGDITITNTTTTTTVDGGALLSIKPLPGLFIGAQAKLGPTANWATGAKPTYNAEYWYKKSQIAVGYTIPDVGLARAQFIGADHSYAKDTANTIEAAFAYTGTEGLTVDLGFKYPVQLKDDNVKGVRQKPLHAALGAKFAAGDFDITGRVDADFAGSKTEEAVAGTKTETSDALKINIHLLPRYNIGFATLGLELGFIINGDKVEDTGGTKVTTEGGVQFGAGLWLFKSWGNGTAQAGVSFQPNTEPTKGTYQQGFIAVPLIFTYSF